MPRIVLNNVRNIELDQMAARAICDPNMRSELYSRTAPHDRPVRELFSKIKSDLANGYIYGYSYVPEGMMFRGLNTGLKRSFKKGALEHGQLKLDKRGHFFALETRWAADFAFETPDDKDAVLLGVSHHMANIWSAHEALDLFEDLGKFSLDTSMRAYCSRTSPDIPIEDIDVFIILDRSEKKLGDLIQRVPERIRETVSDRIFMVPAPEDKKADMASYVANYCMSNGIQRPPATNMVKDPFELTFWEMQRALMMRQYSDIMTQKAREFHESVEALRRVIGSDPGYWGKQGDETFDPLGLIDYLTRTGRAQQNTQAD